VKAKEIAEAIVNADQIAGPGFQKVLATTYLDLLAKYEALEKAAIDYLPFMTKMEPRGAAKYSEHVQVATKLRRLLTHDGAQND